MKSLLITGHLGYIGTNLMQYLQLPINKKWLPRKIDVCDLRHGGKDFSEIKDKEYDACIHLAAYASVMESMKPEYEYRYLHNNAFSLISFLKNNKIKRFIFASTGGAIYGNNRYAHETDARIYSAISPYGQSKWIAEEIIREMQPNHLILRLGNVEGGIQNRQDRTAQQCFREDNPITVYGDPIRDFIGMDTVCEAFVRGLNSTVKGTFNIGTSKGTRIKLLGATQAGERNVPIRYLPARPGEVNEIILDCSAARMLGLLDYREY